MRRKSVARFRPMKPAAPVCIRVDVEQSNVPLNKTPLIIKRPPCVTPPSPPSPASEPELGLLCNELFEEQIDLAPISPENDVIEALAPSDPPSDKEEAVDAPSDEEEAVDAPSEEDADSPSQELTDFYHDLVTCPRCKRIWDGNAQCYPCLESDDEE